MIEMSNFYKFGDGYLKSTFQAELVDPPEFLPDSKNDRRRLKWGDYEGIDFPVVFRHVYGRTLKDILGTGSISFYLISDRMKIVLEQNNLTGWKMFPIKLFGKKREEIPGYHGFSVTGRSGGTDYSNGVMIEKESIAGTGLWKYYKGMTVDLTKWDKTDFFKPESYEGIIVTEKAAMTLKSAHITNVKLTKLTDVEIRESLYKWHMSKRTTQ
jgi:hypothetical protein